MIEQVLLGTAVLLLPLLAWGWWTGVRRRRLLATIEVVTLRRVKSRYLHNERDIYVYLPPGYWQAGRPFPTLYVNDGQDRRALRLHETLAALTAAGQIAPLIVVAIPTNEQRLYEYGTAVAPNAQELGTQAAAYAQFVTQELLPRINREFTTAAAPAQTGFLGASLGGLSAFDIVWNHPDLFGIVGVMSGSFWWRAAADETRTPPNELIAHAMVRAGTKRPLRAWFEAATLDETADRDQNGVIDAIQDTVELIEELEALGCRRGQEILYVEVKGGRHNYDTWSRVLPHFLRWAFPPQKGR